jgi:hypothetical protein
MPITIKKSPSAEMTAPRKSNPGSGPCHPGIGDTTAQKDNAAHQQRLHDKGRAPADAGRDEAANQRPGCGADPGPGADRTECACARGKVGKEHRGKDIDRGDQQGRADAL